MKSIINSNDKPDSDSTVSNYDWSLFSAIPDKKTRINIMLIALWEFAGLHYKAECMALEYAIPCFADTCNAYGEKGKELREMILKECEGK